MRSDIEYIVYEYEKKHTGLYALLEKTVSPSRMQHSICVANRSVELVMTDSNCVVEYEHVWLAGIAHDFCRELSFDKIVFFAKKSGFSIEAYEQENPILLHGKAAVALLCEKYPLEKYVSHSNSSVTVQESVQEIYFAIAHHTLGWKIPNYILLILFIADATSKDRGMEATFCNMLSKQDIYGQCIMLIDFLVKKYKHVYPITKAMYDYCMKEKIT